MLLEKIEKILSEIELVEKYYISNFDNKITSLSILSNSTPDKLMKEFRKYDVNISAQNNVWYLNE